MQRQSEISNSSSRSKTQHKPKASSSSTTQQQQQKLSTTPTRSSARRVPSPKHQQQQQQQQSQRTPVKIIKSKKPLIHFKFYLDICDHQQTKKIEEKIKQLGGQLEFFLTPTVTHFITDKSILPPTVSNNNNTLSSRPGTPQTPATPQTPYSHDSPAEPTTTGTANNKNNVATPSGSRRTPSIRQSRADAILNRARRGSVASIKLTKDLNPSPTATTTTPPPTTPKVSLKLDNNNSKQPYIVWQTEQALRFFAKVQNDLKNVLAGGGKASASGERKSHHNHHSGGSSKSSSRAFGPTHLKGSFIKIESLKRNYRPYYQLFKKPAEWPKIELTREDGAFRLSPKKEFDISEDNKKMTRKSRSRSSQRQQQQQQQPQPTALPAAVQALKKNADSFKSSGQKCAASNANTIRKQATAAAVKESSEKQCGVCEICKIEYDTLTIHLKTKDHEYFAKNSQNFIALDTLINSSADVNKFLEEEQRQEMELEEMEVEEHDVYEETNALAHDPLEDSVDNQLNKRQNCDDTPSPTLREKSKRTTKGKHSSEKFQHITTRQNSKSPKSLQQTTTTTQTPSATKSSSPKKQSSTTLKVLVVGHDEHAMGTRNKTATAANTAAAATTVSSASAVYSPPLRAMLPPSSMYKVVDATPTADVNTPIRKTQATAGATHAVNSPAIIVKFKKVRETELCRLSGEADRFMFRKQRSSSDLPTDLDRQTTSDHLRGNHSSTSLDSSVNDATTSLVELVGSEKTETKKAIAKGKRRKGTATAKATKTTVTTASPAASTENRRFPSAPIQPEIQQLKQTNLVRNKTTTAAAPESSKRLSLPEATRKSSRTATAIVTAATTSSRLLRAAVEAAKKASSNEPTTLMNKSASAADNSSTNVEMPMKVTRSSRLSVVKMEDRMGDAIKNSNKVNDDDENYAMSVNFGIVEDDDDDDEEDDDEITEDDADNDEDFIVNTKLPKVTSLKKMESSNDLSIRHTTREERAARRWTQRLESLDGEVEDVAATTTCTYGKSRKLSQTQTTPTKKQATTSTSTTKATTTHMKKIVLSSPQQRRFDIMKSERLSKLRYAFERLPVTDLWYRVYSRQDAGEERYFEYYGSTQYRKLPYEMGPIPFEYTQKGPAAKCCTICQKAGRVPMPKVDEKADETFVKKEPIELMQKNTKISQTDSSEMKTIDTEPATTLSAAKATNTTSTLSSSSYTHKHKKLHLLQRYHQELLQEQQQKQAENHAPAASAVVSKCDSKASTPELEAIEQRIVRAGSTHSNTSSCTVSSAGTLNSQRKYRNKHLNKANLLNLELPPRKSPREHASTLALVSCIIRQRQDSMSKTNSETDEPAALPLDTMPASPLERTRPTTPPLPSIEDDVKSIKAALKKNKTPTKIEGQHDKPAPTTPELRSTRSAAATPVEELRFATEISETVKRMRRGQNKYDHSPPIVLKTVRPTRGKSKALTTSPPLDRRSFKARSARNTPQTPTTHSEIATNQRRRPRSLLLPSMSTAATTTVTAGNTSSNVRRRVFGRGNIGRPPKASKCQPSIRKTGSKKGVLEFEVDTAALKALKAAMAPQPSPRQLEWQIDKYLELAARDYDCEDFTDMLMLQKAEALPKENVATTTQVTTQTTTATKARKSNTKTSVKSKFPPETTTSTFGDVNTPPPTDCFSSDFDLYDLFTSKDPASPLVMGSTAPELATNAKPTNFSLYSSVALQNYFRRRKTAKSNRTGWPKAQKKKVITSLRHQHLLRRQKSRGHQMANGEQNNQHEMAIKIELDDEAASSQDVASTNDGQRCASSLENAENDGDGVITPPDSDVDDNVTVLTNDGEDYENNDDDDADGEFLDAIDDTAAGNAATNGIDEYVGDCDGETIADSIEIERCCTADLEIDAEDEGENDHDHDADDDEDDDDDDDDDGMDFEDDTTTMFMEQRGSKRLTLRQRSAEVISPILLKRTNALHSNAATAANAGNTSLTSTPTTAAGALGATSTTTTPTTTTTSGTANMLRGLRRTPVLLNGSLGSCISPTEKAGDNSDIFTVSSDGLDTDLDLSNSHTQNAYNESHDDNAHCPHRTPKRKYDITKYAPNSKNARTCAAEAATAAVKSLAISQFLKKEVRVTCRRLRPPFRRFRFRR